MWRRYPSCELIVAASPVMLGLLRPAIDRQIRAEDQIAMHELARDLTKLTAAELHDLLAEAELLPSVDAARRWSRPPAFRFDDSPGRCFLIGSRRRHGLEFVPAVGADRRHRGGLWTLVPGLLGVPHLVADLEPIDRPEHAVAMEVDSAPVGGSRYPHSRCTSR